MTFTWTAQPAQHEATVTEVFDSDEFVVFIFDGRSQRLHRVEGIAAAVWLTCSGSDTVDAIVAELAAVFPQNREEVPSSVEATLQLLWDAGLLVGSAFTPATEAT